MTERWRRDIERLGDADAPLDRIRSKAVGRRVHTPVFEPPRGRQRAIAAVVAFAVFLGAGAFVWQAFRPGPETRPLAPVQTSQAKTPQPLVVTLRGPSEPSTPDHIVLPTASFRLGDDETEIPTQGIEGWPGIPDDLSVPVPLYSLGFDVPAGTPIVIEGDAASASAVVRDHVSIPRAQYVEIDLRDGSGALPDDRGLHVMDLTGTWPDGQATFTAQFRIVPDVSSVPLNPKVPPSPGAPSAHAARVHVPDVDGMPLEEASLRLREVGLEALPMYLASDSTPQGTTTSSEPKASVRVNTGTAVEVFVSAGPSSGDLGWIDRAFYGGGGAWIGVYRGPQGSPVVALSAGEHEEAWRARFEQARKGPFDTKMCPVTEAALQAINEDLIELSERGGDLGALLGSRAGVAFDIDPGSCSVVLQGSFDAETIAALVATYGDGITIVDGVRFALTIGSTR